MADELHIASLVVHANPANLDPVAQSIGAMPGATIHAATPNGKFVVTLEAGKSDNVLATVARIQELEGVLSAALVYQYADSREAMMKEIPDDH